SLKRRGTLANGQSAKVRDGAMSLPSSEDDHATDVPSPAPELRSFGRRRGRKLSPTQERLLADVLPRVAATTGPGDDAGGPVTLAPDLSARLESNVACWIEIGFGGGEHLVWQAEHNTDVTLIGCEPFVDGVVKVLSAIDAAKRRNIFVHDDDARPLLEALPAGRLTCAFILFPDPWPKKRHQKRRLVNDAFLDQLARVLAPGAEVRFATDIPDYARSALLAFTRHPSFVWPAVSRSDWSVRGDDWPKTRYEAKAEREGRRSCYFRFFRRDETGSS
ncbi:MAG: tRNA (guanine(46)-N(7))-methyltransferase TrmB, partial [Pseudomonadota bacterium]